MSYQKINEYDYLLMLSFQQWWAEVECSVSPLQEQKLSLLRQSRYPEVLELELKIECLVQQMMPTRNRSIETIHRLELDSQLRTALKINSFDEIENLEKSKTL